VSLEERVKEAIHGRADVIIGKKGLTAEVLKEVGERLKVKEVVKVRVLKTALVATGMDRRTLAERVASELGAVLLDVRGRTFVLYKPKRSKRKPSGGKQV